MKRKKEERRPVGKSFYLYGKTETGNNQTTTHRIRGEKETKKKETRIHNIQIEWGGRGTGMGAPPFTTTILAALTPFT